MVSFRLSNAESRADASVRAMRHVVTAEAANNTTMVHDTTLSNFRELDVTSTMSSFVFASENDVAAIIHITHSSRTSTSSIREGSAKRVQYSTNS